MEGRDIGTVVFPAADLKVFLEATPEIRARRRLQDILQAEKDTSGASVDAVLRDITERDRRDQTREVSPLVPAADAVHIDTSKLTAAQAADRIVEIARTRRPPATHGNSGQ